MSAIPIEASKRPLSIDLGLAARNYAATMIVLCCGALFYIHFSKYHMRLYGSNWSPLIGALKYDGIIRAADLIRWCVFGYGLVLLPYYALRSGIKSKALIVWEYLIGCIQSRRLSVPTWYEKQAILILVLKFFFIPFCLNGILGHAALLNNQLIAVSSLQQSGISYVALDLYNRHFHALALNLIFIFDFVPFVIGYMVESKLLDNEIKSVDATLFGWLVCLLCYPPFNTSYGEFFSWATSDFARMHPLFSAEAHLTVNILIVITFALYAWASVALGFKCSNLTNRGTIDRGPYAYVRHPAYALKNLAWWLAGIPMFYALFQQSIAAGIWGVFCMSGWTVLYVLRSITEERNMLSVDTGYRQYMGRVRYRFLPGLF